MDPTCCQVAEVIRWDEVCYAPDFWGPFDAVVYNIGDNYPFHAGAIELVQRFPGVVIFHDYFLLDLFRAWCVASGNLALGDRILDDLYGEGTAVAFTPWMVALTFGSTPANTFL